METTFEMVAKSGYLQNLIVVIMPAHTRKLHTMKGDELVAHLARCRRSLQRPPVEHHLPDPTLRLWQNVLCEHKWATGDQDWPRASSNAQHSA